MEFQETPARPTEYLPPRESEAVIRAKDIRANLHQDMHTTAVGLGLDWREEDESLLDALVGDAMFQIEHLLVEVEALHIEKRARDEKDAESADGGSLSEQLGAEVYHG